MWVAAAAVNATQPAQQADLNYLWWISVPYQYCLLAYSLAFPDRAAVLGHTLAFPVLGAVLLPIVILLWFFLIFRRSVRRGETLRARTKIMMLLAIPPAATWLLWVDS